MASSLNYTIYAGDAEPLRMTMLDYDGISSIDLSTVTQVRCEFKRVLSDPDSVAYISKTLLVQTLTITGTPTGGTFTATIGGQAVAIPYNSSAANVKILLETLTTVGAGNSLVAGGPFPATPITVILISAADNQTISTVGAFTGGSSPAITPTATGGGVTIVSPTQGAITVQLSPADTSAVTAQLVLQYAAKAYFSAAKEVTGAAGLLTITATVIHTT